MIRTSLLVVVAVLAGLLVMVLSGSEGEPGHPDADGTVNVTMVEYTFEPDELFVPAGSPVTLSFENQDDINHTVMLGRTAVEEGSEAGFDEDLLAGLSPVVVPERAHVGPTGPDEPFQFVVEPQETVQLRVTFPEERIGEWEMGCFNACGAHFRAGLEGTVHVEPPE